MGVEFKFPWRWYDKSGNLVAEGLSNREKDSGDFYLNDDGDYENKETGELKSGNIVYVDKNGNPVELPVKEGLDGSIVITNNGGKKESGGRAFGEIRSNLGSGVSPAFEQAVHTDRPKIENPNEPTPETPSPSDNGGSGGSLIGEISKQNKILQNLVSKMGSNNNARKISGAISSLSNSLKSSIGKISDNLKEVSKNNGANISLAIGSLNQNLAKISDSSKGRFDIEKERHTYEKTPQNIKDLDGETVANLSPRDAQTANNATQAKKNTDINNFELLESDIEDLFGDLPDITGLFDVPYSSSVGMQFVSKKNGGLL